MPRTISLRDRLLTHYLRSGLRGFHRLRRLLGGEGHLLRMRTSRGAFLELDPTSYIDGFVLKAGYYESEVLDAVVRRLLATDVFWDVGANFGLHSIHAAAARPGAIIVAFEPNPAMANRVRANAELNGLDVSVQEIGLSDQIGEVELHLADAGNPGASSITAWDCNRYESKLAIVISTADAMIAEGTVPSPTLMKIDVEGHEEQVLSGCKSLLRNPKLRMIVFEDGIERDTAAKNLLRENGFVEISPLVREENTCHPLANFIAERHPPTGV